MDDIVIAAMAKWPHVPEVFGWLRLDGRGMWWLKNQRLNHVGMLDFIQRNYSQDAQGRPFFQNGPQRVYLELAATPWIWRLTPDGSADPTDTGTCTVHSHTGLAAQVRACLVDEAGRVYLETDLGIGLSQQGGLQRLRIPDAIRHKVVELIVTDGIVARCHRLDALAVPGPDQPRNI